MVGKAVVTKLPHSRNCPALPYSYTKLYEWSHEVGLDMETEISAGVPVLAEGSVSHAYYHCSFLIH